MAYPLGRHSYDYGDRIEYSFWLSFSSDGSIGLSRMRPSLQSSQRACQVTAVLPKALFKTPELSATITVDEPAVNELKIDTTAAAEALRAALGVDIDIKVKPPEGE